MKTNFELTAAELLEIFPNLKLREKTEKYDKKDILFKKLPENPGVIDMIAIYKKEKILGRLVGISLIHDASIGSIDISKKYRRTEKDSGYGCGEALILFFILYAFREVGFEKLEQCIFAMYLRSSPDKGVIEMCNKRLNLGISAEHHARNLKDDYERLVKAGLNEKKLKELVLG